MIKNIRNILIILITLWGIVFLVGSALATTSTQTVNVSVTVEGTSSPPSGGGTPPTPPIPALTISGVATSSDSTPTSTSIVFQTNRNALSRLSYGTTTAYGQNITESVATSNHSILLSNLTPSTTYHFMIYVDDLAGQTISSVDYQFTTPGLADTAPPTNVSNLQIQSTLSSLILTWVNPSDSDFAGVRIVRSTIFYPANINDGTVVYQGSAQRFEDSSGLQQGVTYYYSVFARDNSNNYSSGAIVSGKLLEPEPPPPPPPPPPSPPPAEGDGSSGNLGGYIKTTTPTTTPTSIISEKEDIPPEWKQELDKIKVDKFDISQDGKNIIDPDKGVGKVSATEPLKIGVDCNKLPDFVKTVIVNLGKEDKNFSFILCSKKQDLSQGITAMPPDDPGEYSLSVLFLDFRNQVVKKMNVQVEVFKDKASLVKDKQTWYQKLVEFLGVVWGFWWGKILLILLAALIIWFIFWIRKKAREIKYQKGQWNRMNIDE